LGHFKFQKNIIVNPADNSIGSVGKRVGTVNGTPFNSRIYPKEI